MTRAMQTYPRNQHIHGWNRLSVIILPHIKCFYLLLYIRVLRLNLTRTFPLKHEQERKPYLGIVSNYHWASSKCLFCNIPFMLTLQITSPFHLHHEQTSTCKRTAWFFLLIKLILALFISESSWSSQAHPKAICRKIEPLFSLIGKYQG